MYDNPGQAAVDNGSQPAVDNTPSQEEIDWKEKYETAEKRRRDTQSEYTKNQIKLKAIEAEKTKLVEALATVQPAYAIDPEKKEQLDTLKYEDPEAWRSEMNKLEKEARDKSVEHIAGLTGEARAQAEQVFEIERRAQVLDAFNEDHQDFQITPEVIENEIPPRITSKLAKGEVTFEEFLEEAHAYVSKGVNVDSPETMNQPNLSNAGGGQTPAQTKTKESDYVDSYGKLTF